MRPSLSSKQIRALPVLSVGTRSSAGPLLQVHSKRLIGYMAFHHPFNASGHFKESS
jgi:hypothetical protein